MTSMVAPSNANKRRTKEFVLTVEQTEQLRVLAESRQLSENQVVAKALDLYFNLSALFKDDLERDAWHRLSEPSLSRLWDNEQDAIYDDWQTEYGVPEG